MKYQEFLASKAVRSDSEGIKEFGTLHPSLFDFQREITEWSIRKGRSAIFAGCGLGKSRKSLSWGNVVAQHTDKPVIMFTPLAVSTQMLREANAIKVDARIVSSQKDVGPGINITNYEKLHKFNASAFGGVVLDESGILKSQDGAYRTLLIDSFRNHQFRLACTATPAPNDHMELGNHAEFLGVMTRSEMLSMFFVHDGGETQKWRLKGHAEEDFWKWVCSWAVMVQKPSDIGFKDDDFILPPLDIKNHVVQSEQVATDTLFAMPASSLMERRQARRGSLSKRVELAAEMANSTSDQVIMWCNLNDESKALTSAIPGSVEITGSDLEEKKIDAMMGFADGKYRVIVSKPEICGHGMNWQNCHNHVFVGLSDSFESFYQAVRRSWRFGQKNPVTVNVVTSHLENAVLENIKRKEADHEIMAASMIKHMKNEMELSLHGITKRKASRAVVEKKGEGWTMRMGDCVELIQEVPSDSVHYSIFSPPFASLYTYSDSEKDMGNCRDAKEFMEHFKFLTSELYRVAMPGRLLSFHCMNLPTSKTRDGVIGISDFRGDLIRTFQESGFIYHSEVCIWKDPVTAMQRTKALGLLHKQIKKDSCMSRQGIPDYLVTMRKPGNNPERVTHTNESFPVDLWQRYASPVWFDINPSDTLQKDSAREQKDERHIAPLQLQVIRRALELWTNPNDVVLSPFAGIGSEGWESIKTGRQFLGFELKESYFKQSVANLGIAVSEKISLLDDVDPLKKRGQYQSLVNTHFREVDMEEGGEFVKEQCKNGIKL